MIDTHCHLTYAGLSERVEQVVADAAAAGVNQMISVGTSPDDARAALALAKRFTNVWATIGLHPHYTDKWTDREAIVQTMRELAANPRLLAFGEMGLDWHYPEPAPEVQRRGFAWQLEAAREIHATSGGRPLPVIIHNREATSDTLAMLRDSGIAPGRLVFHCFTGTPEELDAILAFGAMVGFTGIVTFRNARALAAAAARVPLDRLLIETDSPYLAPEPHRRIRTNEPKFAIDVARSIAHERGMDVATLTAATDANARRFFGIPG